MHPLSRRQLLKRSTFLAAGAAICPSVLVACLGNAPAGRTVVPGSVGPVSTTAGASAGAAGTTRILVGFGTGNAPEQIPPQDALAMSFEEAHAGSLIDFLRIPDTDDAQRQLGVLIAGGDPPDIVLPTGLFGVALYLDQDVWVDLSGMMDAAGIELDLFHEATHRAARAVNYYGTDSTSVIGIPAGIFTHAVAYNKDLFAAAGIDEPPHVDSDDWTYERQLDVAKALTLDAQGRSADQPGFDPSRIVQFGLGHWDTGMMIRGFGGQLYDPASRMIQLGEGPYIEGVQFGADLISVHHVLANDELAAGVAAGADDPQLAAWKSGKVAMIDMCACDLLSFGLDNGFAWDVAQWPRGPERLVSHLNLDLGAIVAASDRRDAAFEILQFLLVDPDNGVQLSTEAYGAMSPLKSQSGAFVDRLQGRFPDVDLQVFVDALAHSSPEQEEWFPAYTQVNDMGGQFLDAVYQGEASAAGPLARFQEAAQEQVDEWFRTHTPPEG